MRTPERSADGSVGAAAIRTELSAADAATPSIAAVAANLMIVNLLALGRTRDGLRVPAPRRGAIAGVCGHTCERGVKCAGVNCEFVTSRIAEIVRDAASWQRATVRR